MTWIEISNKYKDTEPMKEFMWYYTGDEEATIQDVWGYLLVFAETKKYDMENKFWEVFLSYSNFEKAEKSMLWCADKFFEELVNAR